MAVEAPIIGSKVFVAWEGTVVDGVTVSDTVAPDETPPENWTSLGCVTSNGIQTVYEGEDKVKCPDDSYSPSLTMTAALLTPSTGKSLR